MANKGVKRNTKGGKRPHMDSGEQFLRMQMNALERMSHVGQSFGFQTCADFFMIECMEHGVSAKVTYSIAEHVEKDFMAWMDKYFKVDEDDEKTYSFSVIDRKLEPAVKRIGKEFIPYWVRYRDVIEYLQGCTTEADREYQERKRTTVAMSDVERKLREKITAATKRLKTTKDPKLRDGLLAEIEATEKLLEDIHGGL